MRACQGRRSKASKGITIISSPSRGVPSPADAEWDKSPGVAPAHRERYPELMRVEGTVALGGHCPPTATKMGAQGRRV